MPTANINLTVGTFRDITATNDISRWSTATLTLPPPPPGPVRVTLASPTKLVVSQPGAIDLVFTVLSSTAGDSYTPQGLWFEQQSGNQDLHGLANFGLQDITGNTFTVRNLHVHSGPPANRPGWKYFLVIRRQDGALGIIDPEIENEN